MNFNNLDDDYKCLVENIINDDDFSNLKHCEHHGISRYEHSLKVSYKAYKFALKHGFNYKETAVAGLLHDFFNDENYGMRMKFVSIFTHPNKALANALKKYELSDRESNIIKSHMFPLNITLPRYKESWLVSLCDKEVAIKEFISKFGYKLRYVGNLILLILFNYIK